MLDTNIHDEIIATRGMPELLARLHTAGVLDILKTHIQEDEISEIPDIEKRLLIRQIAGEKVISDGSIFGVSRFGESTFGSGSDPVKVETVQRGNPKHAEDSLIASTAEVKADVFVTNDKQLARRIASTGTNLVVWDYAQFKKFAEEHNAI